MILAIALNVAAQIILKRAGGLSKNLDDLLLSFSIYPAIGTYFLSFILFSQILRTLPLSVASPLLSGGTFLLSSLAGVLLFDETLKTSQVYGMVLIILGIVLISAGNPPAN